MILILFSRINDLDHLIPVAYNLSKHRSDLKISFIPRTLHLNFDLDEISSYKLIKFNEHIQFINIFQFSEINFLLRAILNVYYRGSIKLLQTKLFAKGIIKFSLGARFSKFITRFKLIIIDHQANPKNKDQFNGIDNQILTKIMKDRKKIISIPHSYWHLSNGGVDFSKQFSNFDWALNNNDLSLISNSKNWTSNMMEYCKYKIPTYTSDRFSWSWYQVYIDSIKQNKEASSLRVIIFETGGSSYEKAMNLNSKWEELHFSLKDHGINFVLSGHTRSRKKRITDGDYSKMSGFYDVLNSDVVITTYSSMAYDAFLLNKIIIWPKFLANPKWKSSLDVYSNFYYVDTIEDCVRILRDFNEKHFDNSNLTFNNQLDDNNLISSFILDSLA